MANQLVPTVRTPITLPIYTGAVVRAWRLVGEGLPSKGSVGVLWSQFSVETGGSNCYGWNLGNVKKVDGDGYDYHCLNGVWEGFSPAVAEKLIASGQARPDPSPSHAKAVGPNQVSVLFNPPHPATRFRAFPNLDLAMEDHLVLLAKKRFNTAWPAVLAGDCLKFAQALKAKGYYTASAEAYASGMAVHFANFMKSQAYEGVIAEVNGEPVQPQITLTLANFATLVDYQRELLAEGYDLGSSGADGVMGPKTKAAIVLFQQRHGLEPDGIVGPKTRQAFLSEALNRATHGTPDHPTRFNREEPV